MRQKLRTLRVIACLAVLAFQYACTPATALRQHPDFDSSRKLIERVAVLPPTVKIERIMFTGDNETLDEEQDSYPKKLTSSATHILNNHGYATCKVDLLALAAEDTDVAFQIEQIKNAYEAASQELHDGTVAEDDYKRFRVSLGPVVNAVADIADADALLLVKYEGVTKSDGQMKKDIAANVLLGALTGAYYHPIKSVSAVEVAIIDGATGDILWVNTDAKTGISTTVLSSALGKIPEGVMQELIAEEEAAEKSAAKAKSEARDEAAKAEGVDPATLPATWQ